MKMRVQIDEFNIFSDLEEMGIELESDEEAEDETDALEEGDNVQKPIQKPKFKYLRRFSVNLTELAMQGTIDPIIGREKELQRVMQVLCRRKKKQSCTCW